VSAAFLFSHGAVSKLNGIDPAAVQVHAQKINSLGQIAGEYRDASNLLHTFIYDQGVITDLGTFTTPSDLNDRGEVFGEGFQGPHSQPCFIYKNGTFQYLGALGVAAYVNCSARRMNNAGVAIGYVTGSGGPPNANSSGAFLYSDGKLNRFTDLIVPSDELIRDNLSPELLLINDKNEIIAKTVDAGRNVQYYLLTPVDAADSAYYNFEADTQGWSNAGEDILTVSTSTAQKFAGASSLAIQISTGGFGRVAVATPPVPAGRTLTFHIYLPADANMDWIQPFAQEGEAGGWNWHGNWQPLSALQLGAWNTITVQVPDEAQPLNMVGLELYMSQTYSGTVYVDSVSF